MKEEFEKVTVRLAVGTKEELQRYFPDLPYNEVIRTALRALINSRKAADAQTPPLPL